MLFRDIIGQHKIKEALIKSVHENHISHAQLFLGNEGCGNLPLAVAYAQYINCKNRKEDDACGECPSCLKYERLIHPDLHFVFPVSGPKDPVSDDFISQWRELFIQNPYFTVLDWYRAINIENKQGSIHKSESEQIIKKISMKTFEAEYKVMIIWLPETMNTTCANKLLKIIEEPPDKTLFLLVAFSTEDLLITILSRTQILRIPRIDDESMMQKLIADNKLSQEELKSVIQIADGSYSKALDIINTSEENQFNFEQFHKYMQLCYLAYRNQKIPELVKWIEAMAGQGREKQKAFIQHGLRMIRECFMLNLNQHNLVYLTETEYKVFCENFSKFITPGNVNEIVSELNKAFIQIEMNANDKVLFMDMAFKIGALLQN